MSLPLKELIKIGQTQLKEAGVGDADRDARDLYCFLDKIDTCLLYTSCTPSTESP